MHVHADYYLSCTSSTTLISKYRPVMYLSSTTNATLATASTTDYPVIVQCLFDDGRTDIDAYITPADCFGNIPAGDGVGLLKVSSGQSSNLHAEAYELSNYTGSRTLCLYTLKIGLFSYSTSTLQMNNCNGYATTVFSAPPSFNTTGNSHLGDANAYPLKFCLTAQFKQNLIVSLNTNSVGFGTLSPSQILYATSNGAGTTTATSSFMLDVSVVGNTDYSVYLSGDTLRNSSAPTLVIPGVGASPTSLVAGIDAFGIQATTTCLSSPCYTLRPTIQSPYNTSLFGFNLSTTTQILLGVGGPNDYNSTVINGGSRFYFTLGATISANKPAGTYNTNLTIIVTPNF